MIDFASGVKNTPISSYRNVVKKDNTMSVKNYSFQWKEKSILFCKIYISVLGVTFFSGVRFS